ncbi:MAG: hypothetical protein WEA80_13110 [Gemmatimonadaceae bacterium]
MSINPSFSFAFNIGKAFLDQPSHPITVPREQVDYAALEASSLNRQKLSLLFPRGERNAERFYTLYQGTAGRGPYYQLQLRGERRDLPVYLKLHDRLLVILFKYGHGSYVVLEYRDE